MNITVWNNFSKRDKSTLQPTGGTSISNVILKEATSVESPTFVLSSNDLDINYVQAFGHYYFVDDVQSVRNGVIEVKCSIDPGATYKSDIGSYNAYVERSASSYDVMIADPEVVIKNSRSYWQSGTPASTNKIPSIFDAQGSYIISVLNDVGSGAGFTTYYAIGVPALQTLASYCNQNLGDDVSITDFIDWLKVTFLKTADAIIDCKWLPVSWSTIQSAPSLTSEQIKIGKDPVAPGGVALYAYRFTNISVVASTAISINLQHRYSDFRKANPYTRGLLNLPFYGFWEFNPLDFNSDTIAVQYAVDLSTGDCMIVISGDKTVATLHIDVGLTVPVGKVGNQGVAGVSQFLSGATGVAAALSGAASPIAGIASAALSVNGFANMALGISPSVHGSMQGRAGSVINRSVYAILTFCDTSDPADLVADKGRPLMDRVQISTLSGYVKCSDADVPISAKTSDRKAVNDLLNSGFYYE